MADAEDAPPVPVPSSTVMVLRDGPQGALEVFMLERHVRSEFAGGALVFPGGKVDDADRRLDPAFWEGVALDHAAEELGCDSPGEALGYLVAAVRETFEEAGVFVGCRPDGAPVTVEDLRRPDFVEVRRALADRETTVDFEGWLAEHDLVLDLGALAFWSWWVTPEFAPRRYDTRFFLVQMPPEQAGALSHDEVETTSSRWISPEGALAAHEREEVNVVYPTRKNLEALAKHTTAQQAWEAAAAGQTDRRRIQPTVVLDGGEILVRHPDGGSPEPA